MVKQRLKIMSVRWTKSFYRGYVFAQGLALEGEPEYYIVDHLDPMFNRTKAHHEFDAGMRYAARLLAKKDPEVACD